MDPKKLGDLELAEILVQQMEQLQVTANNVKILREELARRKDEKKNEAATDGK